MKRKSILVSVVSAAVLLSAIPVDTGAASVSALPAVPVSVSEGETSDVTAETTTTAAPVSEETTVTTTTAAPASAEVTETTTTAPTSSEDTVTTTTSEEPEPVTFSVRFYGFEGELLGKVITTNISEINSESIDTSVLTYNPDVYTEIGFSSWSTPELQEDGSYAVYALSQTAVFNVDDIIAPDRDLYYSRKGKVRLDGISIPLTITTQIDERDEDGNFKTVEKQEDVAASCYSEPATLEEAFAVGDIAPVSVYSPGEEKPLYSFNIYCQDYFGDVNLDSSVDSSDAALVLKYYAEVQADPTTERSADFFKAADVNRDSNFDSSDAAIILKGYALHQVDNNFDIGDANGIIKFAKTVTAT